jgi:outer membrane protein
MRYLLLLLVPAIAAAQTGSAPQARPITLAEAVKLAQQNAPSAVQARGAIDQSEGQVRSTWGDFIPTLSISTGASKQNGQTLNTQQQIVSYSSPWSYSRGLSANLTLFDAGNRMYNLSAARANVASAEANERRTKYQVALDVSTQYFNVLASRENLAAAQAALDLAQEQLKSANARVAAGAATKSDSLRSVVSVGNAQVSVLTAENDLQNANAALTRLVATPFLVTAMPADSLRMDSFAADSNALAQTLETAPTVRSAEASLNAARASLKSSHTPYFPTISMNYGISGSNRSDSFDPWNGLYPHSNTLRFSFSYTLFNGFNREQTVTSARVAQRNAEASLRDAKLVAQQQLIQYLGTLRLAQERIQIQDASVAAAQEDVRVQQQRYALGATTLLDLLTSQSSLTSARYSLIRARYDARVAKANIELLIGREIQ